MKMLPLLCAAIGLHVLGPAGAEAAPLIADGSFSAGTLAGWTLLTTPRGTLGSPTVALFDVTGAGAQHAARFQVGETIFDRTQQGGGLSQFVDTLAGSVSFSAAFAVYEPAAVTNVAAGAFSVLWDGVVEATLTFGAISAFQTERGSLSFTTQVTAGVHELELLVTRPYTNAAFTPEQFVTDISLTGPTAISASAIPPTPVPEPASAAAFGAGLLALSGLSRRASRGAGQGRRNG